MWGTKCVKDGESQPSSSSRAQTNFLLCYASKPFSKASRDQQVLSASVVFRGSPVEATCMPLDTLSLPEIIFAFFSTKQPALLFVCLLITY